MFGMIAQDVVEELKDIGFTNKNGLVNIPEDPDEWMSIEYKQGLFEGKQETFYKTGGLKTSKQFKGNVQDGPAIEYYEGGAVKSEANFKNGKQSGKTKIYKDTKPLMDETQKALEEKKALEREKKDIEEKKDVERKKDVEKKPVETKAKRG